MQTIELLNVANYLLALADALECNEAGRIELLGAIVDAGLLDVADADRIKGFLTKGD